MTPAQLKQKRIDRDWSLGREQRRQMIAQMHEQADENARRARAAQAAFEEQQALLDEAMILANQAIMHSVMGAFAGILR